MWKRLAGLVTLIGGMVWVTGCGKLVAPVDTYGFVQAFSGVAEEGNEGNLQETPFQAHRTHWCSPFSRRLMQVSGRRHAHISKPCVCRMPQSTPTAGNQILHTAVSQQVNKGSMETSA